MARVRLNSNLALSSTQVSRNIDSRSQRLINLNVALWGLNDNGSHKLIYLNIWFLVGETLGEGLNKCHATLHAAMLSAMIVMDPNSLKLLSPKLNIFS